MFSLSSLVGSTRPERGLEFTPIGRRSHTNTAFSAPADHFDPSFDLSSDSSDTLHSMSINGVSPGHRTRFPEQIRAPENLARAKTLLGSGSSSIQDLQAENKELSGENYNLKIEVATLTKFLKQTPPDLREVASENVQLKQEILKLSEQLLAQHGAGIEALLLQKMAEMERKLEEKDRLIHTLEARVQQAKNEFRTPPEVLEHLEFLKNENQKLIRRSESAIPPEKSGALEAENNALKTELYKLKNELLEAPKDAQAQLDRAEQQSRLHKQKIDELQDEVSEKTAQLEAFRKSSDSSERMHEQDRTLEALRMENRRLVQENEHLARSRTSEQSSATELRKLKNELELKDRLLDLLHKERESDGARVQAKMASLRRELQEKDQEEVSMRAQIRALMRDNGALSSLQHYEAQFEQMRQKEQKLSEENRTLKDENATLQDELYRRGLEKSHDQSEKVAELSDKLVFYEKEYDLLQDVMERTEKEKDSVKAQCSRLEDERALLEKEVNDVKSKLRRLEIQEAQKVNESAIFELEEAHRKRQHAEQRRMEAQNEALRLQVIELEKKLASADHEGLRSSLARMQVQMSRLEAELLEKSRLLERTEKSLREKDDLAGALEARVRELSRGELRTFESEKLRKLEFEVEKLRKLEFESERREYESERLRDEIERLRRELERRDFDRRTFSDVDRKTFVDIDELRRLQHENETLKSQFERDNLRNTQFELENLRRAQLDSLKTQQELQEEVRFYKTKLDTLMESDSAVQPVIALLESEVDEYRQLNKELHQKLDLLREKLEEANTERFNLEASQITAEKDHHKKGMLQELQQSNQRLQEEKRKVEKTLDMMEEEKIKMEKNLDLMEEEKVKVEKSLDLMEEDYKSVRSEKTRLESKARNLAQELTKTSRHCTRLANRVNEMEKGDKLAQMQGEIDQLSKTLAGSKIDRRGKEREDVVKRVLRNEANFFKAKLFDINLKCNDLALMNRFMVNAITTSDMLMKDDLVKMAQSGIYPDYEKTRKKPTFRTLATLVLSMVRMRRRTEKARARAEKMNQLRSEIDRDRITLLE